MLISHASGSGSGGLRSARLPPLQAFSPARLRTPPCRLSHLPLLWSDAEVRALGGTSVGARIALMREEAARLFERVIQPHLGTTPRLAALFSAPGLSLHATFLQALSLVFSRCVDESYGDARAVPSPAGSPAGNAPPSSIYSTRSVFLGLVDLMNGLPEGDDPIGCNVEVHTGTPFASSPLRERCPWDASCHQLPCTVVEATRDIGAGEELLMSYGEMSISEFVVKFGHAPASVVDLPLPQNAICLYLSPAALPRSDDRLRWQALAEMAGYSGPGREAAPSETAQFELTSAELRMYELAEEDPRVDEPASVQQLKLFMLLLLAPSAALHSLLERGTLPVAGAVDQAALGRGLVSLVDHNLQLMAAQAPAADATLSARVVDPAAILIRKERQLLTAWREAFRARFGLPTPANTLHACWTQTQLRAALLPAASCLPEPPADPEGVAKRARQALLRRDSCSPVPALTSTEQPLRGLVHVELAWLQGRSLVLVREAAEALVSTRAQLAGVGPEDALLERVRVCWAVDLLAPVDGWKAAAAVTAASAAATGMAAAATATAEVAATAQSPSPRWSALQLPAPLLELAAAIDRLRIELAAATGRPLVDAVELQLLCYEAGGHYARHVDTGQAQQTLRRSVSFLVYLTQDSWDTARDGGELRIFEPSREAGESAMIADVSPEAGTLVLFDSATIPHAVLPTRRKRLALVGWMMCAQGDDVAPPE